jgi:plasmid stabilization system protein ParE
MVLCQVRLQNSTDSNGDWGLSERKGRLNTEARRHRVRREINAKRRGVGTQEIVVAETPHIIPCRVRGDAVEILRVFHAARKWPEKFERK